MTIAMNVLISVLSSSTVGTLLWFIFKASIEHAAQIRLERYKSDLKEQSDTALETHKDTLKRNADAELEALRAGLRQASDAYAARVGQLYGRRLDVLADGYALLPALGNALGRYTNPMRVYMPGVEPDAGDQALRHDFVTSYETYREFFTKNRLFFDPPAINKIDAFDDFVEDLLRNFRRQGDTEEHRRAWQNVHDKAKFLLPELTEELRKDFARLLGVEQ